jgi:hypothetical protein
LEQPKWFTQKIEKLISDFLWTSNDEASGGKCLVKWKVVCSSINHRDLGIANRQAQGQQATLRVRCLWQSWTDDTRPWIGLPLPIDDTSDSFSLAG